MSKYLLQIFLIVILLSVAACSSAYQILHFDSVDYESNNSEIVEFEKNQAWAELVKVGDGVDCAKVYELKQTLLLYQNLLLSNPELIPISLYFVFEQFRGHAVGDLTGNGLCDVALVFSECYEYIHTILGRRGSRHLFVLIANEYGKFEIAGYSDSVILHQMMAGRFGDGFGHIRIEDGMLSIHQIWGSAHSAGGKICFIVQNDNLILHREEVEAFHSTVGNWYTTTYYPNKGKVEITAGSWNPHTKNIPESGVILFSQIDIPPQKYILDDEVFERRRTWRDEESWRQMELLFYGVFNAMYSQLPFGQEIGSITITASDALTMVQQAYFPDFTRTCFMFDQEIINNFSLLFGFEIPKHFYSNGTYVLRHQMTSMRESPGEAIAIEPIHRFIVHDVFDMFLRPDYSTVRVNGKSGETTLAQR